MSDNNMKLKELVAEYNKKFGAKISLNPLEIDVDLAIEILTTAIENGEPVEFN